MISDIIMGHFIEYIIRGVIYDYIMSKYKDIQMILIKCEKELLVGNLFFKGMKDNKLDYNMLCFIYCQIAMLQNITPCLIKYHYWHRKSIQCR